MKPIKMLATILMKIIFISAALVLFFSMMGGMYYKSSPTKIKTTILDEDQSPLSRSLIYAIKSSQYFDVSIQSYDYLDLQRNLDEGLVDVGVVIPNDAYKNVLNKRSVNILTTVNGTANPIIPKMAMMMLGKIVMTLNMQLSMKVRVEDLGAIPNVRHAKSPLLKVNERVFYDPSLSMESSMTPAFMGLAMQIVSMLIVLFGILGSLAKVRQKMNFISQARQMPIKAIVPPFIISLVIVSTAISIAFFITMHLFEVPYNQMIMKNTIIIISLLVLSMGSLSLLLVLNIKNSAVLASIITLIVFPAFMYSGYLIPMEQLAYIPNLIGNAFPLRHYLQALYPVFN
ncbi:ABC transporter permease, partial [bacterium]|nr:ABC transporter permease [bacterium]